MVFRAGLSGLHSPTQASMTGILGFTTLFFSNLQHDNYCSIFNHYTELYITENGELFEIFCSILVLVALFLSLSVTSMMAWPGLLGLGRGKPFSISWVSVNIYLFKPW